MGAARSAMASRDLLRFVACGSVDDGKSTLIGRLIAETGSVSDDEMQALMQLSQRYGTTGGEIDYALLLDGLQAEREQGITIDVAYRYFGTGSRTFIVADTPGHEQYTRNMATGASNADLAVILVDVRGGLTPQTMRHSRIVALLGIHRVLLAVNKMDLVNFSAEAFALIAQSYGKFATQLHFRDIVAIPISARDGDNVITPSERMSWYVGPTVLKHLERISLAQSREDEPLRFLVQTVTRPGGDLRAYAGFMGSGRLTQGDEVLIARTAQVSRVARLITFDGDLDQAIKGQALTIELADHADVGRGDVIAHCRQAPDVAEQFAAYLVWFGAAPLLPGRTYIMRIGTLSVIATVTSLRHRIQIETGEHIAVHILEANDIGLCHFAINTPVALDSYSDNCSTGAFILIDRETAATVAVGMIEFPLHRASNIRRQNLGVDKITRARLKGQRP